jgi:protein-tyrosine kinase
MRQGALMAAGPRTDVSLDVKPTSSGAGGFKFSSEVVLLSEPRGARAEAIRTLRTHIIAQHLEAGRRGLTICGASAGVGATFVAVNLALALAQVGAKVLLVDGDLRNPQIDQFVVPDRTPPGLRECLQAEDADLSRFIQPEVAQNLSIMFAGEAAPNAQELIASERFIEVIGRCSRDYDIMIVDTPPANLCADGRRVSTVIGYSIIVAKRHVSFVSDLKALAEQLRDDRAQVIGSVLNEG